MSTNEEKHTLTTTGQSEEEIENPLAHMQPKIQRFIHLYMTGQYSLNKLAQLLEVHPNTITNWMRREDVKNAIRDMQTFTHQAVNDQLKAMTEKAITRMRELMDSPIDGVALQAVKDVLDRGGHKTKQEMTKNVNVRTFEEKLDDLIDDVIEGEWEEIE